MCFPVEKVNNLGVVLVADLEGAVSEVGSSPNMLHGISLYVRRWFHERLSLE